MLLLEACPPVSASRHDDRCKKLLRWSLGLRPARPPGLPCPLVGSREAFDGNDALGRKPGCVLAAVLPHPADWTARARLRLQPFRRKRARAAGARSAVATPSLSAWHHPRSSADSNACRLQSPSCAGVSASAHCLGGHTATRRKKVCGRHPHHSERCRECIPHRSATGLIHGLIVFEHDLCDFERIATPRRNLCPDSVNQQHHGRLDRIHQQVHRD